MTRKAQVDNAIDLFRKCPVSEGAKELIFRLLDAIENDPHPSWVMKAPERDKEAEKLVARLPSFLDEIWNRDPLAPPKRITTYDVLHWLEDGHNLSRICPIEKGGKIERKDDEFGSTTESMGSDN